MTSKKRKKQPIITVRDSNFVGSDGLDVTVRHDVVIINTETHDIRFHLTREMAKELWDIIGKRYAL